MVKVNDTIKIILQNLQVKRKFHLRVVVGIIDLEEAMDKFFEVNISRAAQIENREETFANNAWELGVL